MDRLMSWLAVLPHAIAKQRRCWLFVVQPKTRLNGNLRALCDAAVADSRISRIVIDYRGLEPIETIRALYAEHGKRVTVGSGVRFLGERLSADVMFVNALQRFGMPMFSVNLWHGIPLKGINLLAKNAEGGVRKPPLFNRYAMHDRLIASSATDASTMAKCFGVPVNRVIVSGLPRNDWLTMKRLPPDLAQQDNALKAILAGRSLVLYAPTFRDEDRGFVPMSGEELAVLARRIAGQGGVLGWRPHYLMKNIRMPDGLPILDLGAERFPEVQVILRNTACLVTDYSSIALDFMLLKRPVFCFARDHERFSRSFLYDLRQVFPGPFHENQTALADDIERSLADPAHAAQVVAMGARAFPLFHAVPPGQSCATLIDHLLSGSQGRAL